MTRGTQIPASCPECGPLPRGVRKLPIGSHGAQATVWAPSENLGSVGNRILRNGQNRGGWAQQAAQQAADGGADARALALTERAPGGVAPVGAALA